MSLAKTSAQRAALKRLHGTSPTQPKVTSTELPLRTCRQLERVGLVEVAHDPNHQRTWWVWLKRRVDVKDPSV